MISDLPNLGPKSMQMLHRAGIESLAQLERLGAVAAYLAVKRAGCSGASLNLLWALEGAITGRDWKQVAREDRLRLLTQLEEAQKGEPPGVSGSNV